MSREEELHVELARLARMDAIVKREAAIMSSILSLLSDGMGLEALYGLNETLSENPDLEQTVFIEDGDGEETEETVLPEVRAGVISNLGTICAFDLVYRDYKTDEINETHKFILEIREIIE